MPVGGICRTFYSHFPEYHTSLDDLTVVSADTLLNTLDFLVGLCTMLEAYDVCDGMVGGERDVSSCIEYAQKRHRNVISL